MNRPTETVATWIRLGTGRRRTLLAGYKVNCFQVEKDTKSKGHNILGELVDLRFIHVIELRTTVHDLPGKLFTAYLLD
jgi:hypothetical protein